MIYPLLSKFYHLSPKEIDEMTLDRVLVYLEKIAPLTNLDILLQGGELKKEERMKLQYELRWF